MLSVIWQSQSGVCRVVCSQVYAHVASLSHTACRAILLEWDDDDDVFIPAALLRLYIYVLIPLHYII